MPHRNPRRQPGRPGGRRLRRVQCPSGSARGGAPPGPARRRPGVDRSHGQPGQPVRRLHGHAPGGFPRPGGGAGAHGGSLARQHRLGRRPSRAGMLDPGDGAHGHGQGARARCGLRCRRVRQDPPGHLHGVRRRRRAPGRGECGAPRRGALPDRRARGRGAFWRIEPLLRHRYRGAGSRRRPWRRDALRADRAARGAAHGCDARGGVSHPRARVRLGAGWRRWWCSPASSSTTTR